MSTEIEFETFGQSERLVDRLKYANNRNEKVNY